jgi:hypothetical protein
MEWYEAHGKDARLTCRHFGISPETPSAGRQGLMREGWSLWRTPAVGRAECGSPTLSPELERAVMEQVGDQNTSHTPPQCTPFKRRSGLKAQPYPRPRLSRWWESSLDRRPRKHPLGGSPVQLSRRQCVGQICMMLAWLVKTILLVPVPPVSLRATSSTSVSDSTLTRAIYNRWSETCSRRGE